MVLLQVQAAHVRAIQIGHSYSAPCSCTGNIFCVLPVIIGQKARSNRGACSIRSGNGLFDYLGILQNAVYACYCLIGRGVFYRAEA